MQEQNWKTLVVAGDSMTRQTFAGFQCELLRRGYEMKTKVEGDLADPRKGLRYGIRQRKTLTLTKIPGSSKSSKMVDIKIIFYIMYWPTAGSIDQFILGPGTDVYIFDHSLWYRHWEMPKFLEGMTALLKQLTTASMPPKMIMWREQSAQHFNRPGGSYSPKGPEMVPGVDGCVPIHDYTAKYQHVQVMKNATERAGMNFVDPHQQQLEQPPATGPSSLSLSNSKNLYFIPFRDFSSQFHDIHRDGECTHYCSTPDLWLPISRGIRIHMDNYNHLQGQNAASDVRS
ncbi:expressed unknown protein [Seminavis robusta]|nr:expressed unknown protein [Seminavis robusta]|eukprot:Sro1492_g277190.1 n/a (286) ;mRNA; r:7508-8365